MKKYGQLFLGIIIGGFISGGMVYAFTLSSSEITYTTKAGVETTVDKELDKLYEVYGYGTATSSDLLVGKTAYSNGTKLLGTIPIPTTATGNAYTGTSGYLNGSSALTTSTNLTLANYKSNNQYAFNLGGGEQVTLPAGYYDSPISVVNGMRSGTVQCEIFHRASHTSDYREEYNFSRTYSTRPWVFVSYDWVQEYDYNGYIGMMMESYWIKSGSNYTGISIRNGTGNGGAITIYVCETNPFQ